MELHTPGTVTSFSIKSEIFFVNNAICLNYYDSNKYLSDINSFGHFRVLQRNIRSYKPNFYEIIMGIEDFTSNFIVLPLMKLGSIIITVLHSTLEKTFFEQQA